MSPSVQRIQTLIYSFIFLCFPYAIITEADSSSALHRNPWFELSSPTPFLVMEIELRALVLNHISSLIYLFIFFMYFWDSVLLSHSVAQAEFKFAAVLPQPPGMLRLQLCAITSGLPIALKVHRVVEPEVFHSHVVLLWFTTLDTCKQRLQNTGQVQQLMGLIAPENCLLFLWSKKIIAI